MQGGTEQVENEKNHHVEQGGFMQNGSMRDSAEQVDLKKIKG